jgi:hypothetical protein
MTVSQIDDQTLPMTGEEDVTFGISAEGFPVARIGDTTLAMLPLASGRAFLASAWRLIRPFPNLAGPTSTRMIDALPTRRRFALVCWRRSGTRPSSLFFNESRSAYPAARPGVRRSMPPSMPRALWPTRHQAMAASIFRPPETSPSRQPCGMHRVGTKRMSNGRSSRLPFRMSSRSMRGNAPTRRSATASPSRGSGSIAAGLSLVNP